MGQILVHGGPARHESSSRALRVRGVVTSIRLEDAFWHVLGEIGRRDGMAVNQLITKLYDEIIEVRGEVQNFTSFLRVCCLRYVALRMSAARPGDASVPTSSPAADAVRAGVRAAFERP